MTISPPTIIKMDETKHNDIKCNTNHSLQSQTSSKLESKQSQKSKIFAVSAALFIIPSSYSILPLSPVILSTMPIMSSLCVYASSIPQIKEIHSKKSTLNYSHVPFISLLNNGMIWGIYGVLSSNPTIMLTNAIAISSALVCMAVFARNNTNPMNKSVITRHCAYSGLILLSLASSSKLHGDTCDIVSILGSIGCGTALIAYASPLCVMKNVIKNKSTSALSFGLSSTLTMNAATWFCYAWFITDDLYVWMPCLLGFGAGLVQLSLFAIY